MWACFLVTVLAASLYQYLAVKVLDYFMENDSYPYEWSLQPGYIFGVMLAAFYVRVMGRFGFGFAVDPLLAKNERDVGHPGVLCGQPLGGLDARQEVQLPVGVA
jgi:hypothetical protein